MAAADQDSKPAKSGPGLIMWLVMLTVLSLLAAGIGGGIGYMMLDMVESQVQARLASEEAEEKVEHYAASEQLVMLPAVVTNLTQPAGTWVRIEAAVLFAKRSEEPRDVLVQNIAGDILAFVRTLKLSQVSGAYGLLHLREDLTERAVIRSGGEVKEIIVHSLVIE